MSLRLISVSTPDDALAGVLSRAEAHGATGVRVHVETQKPGRATAARDDRLSLLPVETTIPPLETEGPEDNSRAKRTGGLPRAEIHDEVWPQARIGRTCIVLVVLSAVVAAFGMIEDNVAVVIGAMMIAPLPGPVRAFSVGVAMGGGKLMIQAAVSAAVGSCSVSASGCSGRSVTSPELMSRSEIGYDVIAIALAFGAAAALSLVTGIPSAPVGVMWPSRCCRRRRRWASSWAWSGPTLPAGRC